MRGIRLPVAEMGELVSWAALWQDTTSAAKAASFKLDTKS
jgi:hypothetical protein